MPNAIKWGDEFDISNPFYDQEGEPALAALADGRFVAAWTAFDDGYFTEVRIYNTDGSPGDGMYSVDESPSQSPNPSIVALAGGGYALARTNSWGSSSAIVTLAFKADSSLAGSEIVWGGTDANRLSSLAAEAGGGFVAAWHAIVADQTTITVQLFGAEGSPRNGINFASEAYPYAYPPDVATLTGGGHVVVWVDNDHEISASLVNASATGVTDPFRVNTHTSSLQGAPVVSQLANGGFVVVWQSDMANSAYDARGQVFAADGEKVGGEFSVNTTTTDLQYDPEIALLADGRFAVTWMDTSSPDPNVDLANVRVQLFNPDGTRSGDELLVNPPSMPGYHFDPTITALADGRFVVAWQHEFEIENPEGAGLHGQIFDTRQGPVNLVGTSRADNLAGTVFNDTLTGAAGNDYLVGGAGDDTATFSQAREQYTVTELADRIVVAGPDGTDTLIGIEHLRFAVADPGPRPTPDPQPAPPGPPGYISGLFDTVYYLTHYADVSAAGVSARDHYNDFGWHEGRAPNAFFDTVGYLGANPDVRDAGLNPLLHYHQTGGHDGRDPSAGFDTRLYLLHNSDVAGVDPLEHYLQHGLREGRAIYQAIGEDIVGGFDAEWYMLHNPDVAAAGVDARTHFDSFGWHEERNPNGWFDTAGYLAHYADVAAAGVNPLDHYMTFGWREGRDASVSFDTLGYLAANPDVAAADVNPLEHFLTFGIYEGRSAVNDGIWH